MLSVAPGGACDAAGVRVGDIICAANGVAARSGRRDEDVIAAWGGTAMGESITFHLIAAPPTTAPPREVTDLASVTGTSGAVLLEEAPAIRPVRLFTVGTHVEIHGLRSNAELNGRRGVVRGYDRSRDVYQVRLSGGAEIAVGRANVRKRDEECCSPESASWPHVSSMLRGPLSADGWKFRALPVESPEDLGEL